MALIISQGETLQLSAKADAGSVVTFYFAGPSRQTVSGVADTGDASIFTIAANTTEWTPGAYIIEIRAVLEGVTSVVARLPMTVIPTLESLPVGADVRTQAEKAVENIEAMLAGGATIEAKKYKINNRELERYSIKELIALLAFWKRRLGSERRRAAGINSLAPRIESFM